LAFGIQNRADENCGKIGIILFQSVKSPLPPFGKGGLRGILCFMGNGIGYTDLCNEAPVTEMNDLSLRIDFIGPKREHTG